MGKIIGVALHPVMAPIGLAGQKTRAKVPYRDAEVHFYTGSNKPLPELFLIHRA